MARCFADSRGLDQTAHELHGRAMVVSEVVHRPSGGTVGGDPVCRFSVDPRHLKRSASSIHVGRVFGASIQTDTRFSSATAYLSHCGPVVLQTSSSRDGISGG